MAAGMSLLGAAQAVEASNDEESLAPWILAIAATGLHGDEFDVTLVDQRGSGRRARVQAGGAEAAPGLLAELRPGKGLLIVGETGPGGTSSRAG